MVVVDHNVVTVLETTLVDVDVFVEVTTTVAVDVSVVMVVVDVIVVTEMPPKVTEV
jgi:hypothetical protein